MIILLQIRTLTRMISLMHSWITAGMMRDMYTVFRHGVTTQVVYYRKDMFEEVGLDPDEVFATWQNVADAARKLQEHYSDVDDFFGFEPMSGIDCLMDMAYSNGASIVSEDEKNRYV